MRWQKPVGWAMIVGVAVFWVWLISADTPAAPISNSRCCRVTLVLQCYAITADNEAIPMNITCDAADGGINLTTHVQFKKDVVLKEVLIKDSHNIYTEVFDLEAMFGDDAEMAGHKFKKGQTYGFGVQLGIYKRRDTVVSVK